LTLAVPSISSVQESTIEIDDAPEMEVIGVSKTVVIKKHAKAVFVFGGDVVVEGRVDGDVGVIGGNVIQKEGGSIGGDVIVIGGGYRPEAVKPLRDAGKQTLVFGIFEDELRELGSDPTSILSPSLSPAFFAQRILSVLFWFAVAFAFSYIAPGAVSRAIVRTDLHTVRVAGFGLAGLITAVVIVIASLSFLPDYLGAVVWLMIFALLMLAYLFGRIVLQLYIGKWMQRRVWATRSYPDSVAILIGTVFWTLLLSIPYVWTLTLLALFAFGVGLVLTGRENRPQSHA